MLQALRLTQRILNQLLRALQRYAGLVQDCCSNSLLGEASTCKRHAEAEAVQALLHPQLVL